MHTLLNRFHLIQLSIDVEKALLLLRIFSDELENQRLEKHKVLLVE